MEDKCAGYRHLLWPTVTQRDSFKTPKKDIKQKQREDIKSKGRKLESTTQKMPILLSQKERLKP